MFEWKYNTIYFIFLALFTIKNNLSFSSLMFNENYIIRVKALKNAVELSVSINIFFIISQINLIDIERIF